MDVYLRKSGPFDSDPAVEEAAGTPQGKLEGYSSFAVRAFILVRFACWIK
jgi:hypothetical protein